MSESTENDPTLPAVSIEEDGVRLPVGRDRLAEFIARLMGQRQSLEKTFDGIFDFKFEDIENFHALMTHRVSAQNKGELAQFSTSILFEDGFKRVLTSWEDFEAYNEVRSKVTVGLNLRWTFLVNFPERDLPEKQDLSVWIYSDKQYLPDGSSDEKIDAGIGHLTVQIEYTERTWADDVERLISNHIDTVIDRVNIYKLSLKSFAVRYGVSMVMLPSFLFMFLKMIFFDESKASFLKKISDLPDIYSMSINEHLIKISHYIDMMVSRGGLGVFYWALGGAVMGAAVLMSIVIIGSVDRSYLSLTTYSEKFNSKIKRGVKIRKSLSSAFVISTVCGIIVTVGSFFFERSEESFLRILFNW